MDLFNPSDIKWVRNVKREGGKIWAYDDVQDTFKLNWSSRFRNEFEAEKPKVGDIILLFQTRNRKTFLTHLVTPIQKRAYDDYNNFQSHRWVREVLVLASPADLYTIMKPKDLNFRGVGSGGSLGIEHIKIDGKVDKELVQQAVWKVFEQFFRHELEYQFFNFPVLDLNEELALLEGNQREEMRKHLIRERRSVLARQKKNLPPDQLVCECCSCNFGERYGIHGSGYIECHHRIPIHLGERVTKLSDLALVCANCHRMLHRKNSDGEYYSVEQLKDIYQS